MYPVFGTAHVVPVQGVSGFLWLAGGGGLQRGLVALGRRGGADERGEAGHAPGEASGGGGAGRPGETKGNPPSGAMWRPFFLFSFLLGERSPF